MTVDLQTILSTMYVGQHHCMSTQAILQICSHCKLLEGIITLKLLSLFLSSSQEHSAKKFSVNSSELWYSTISNDVKHKASVINTNNQTEYALVNVSKRKENIASAEEHSEYDYVLIT